ncbi:putative fimbrial protein SthD [Serratia fonticola]|nr:minor fimbrial subunit [Serratia fonticola]CAI0820521.1 putative fimbrial protein SthD [Serratia fonticola]CAI1074749.1 putative fimbrial protein SthD [Serratia fonticola]
MNMKNRNVYPLLLSGLLSLASPLQAADVTITVSGKVVAGPCTVSTSKASVALGDIYSSDMISAGAASEWKPVTLSLTGCPIGTSQVTATFSGTADATGYYKNMGTAGNIQIELQDDKGTKLNNGIKKAVSVVDATKSASFPLKVRALSVNGAATQGTIQAVISITYTYA